MTKLKQELTGGSFNLLNSRPFDVVKDEVERLLKKHDLDFLAVQEATEYVRPLSNIDGYTYYTWRDGGRGAQENGVLVKDEYVVDKFRGEFYGDGWTTVTKAYHVASVQNQIRIDGWLLVRGLHLPTPSHWKNGKIVDTPTERKDDLIASVKALRWYLRLPSIKNARIAVGDWNEAPTTTGEYSPQWLAQYTDSVASTPQSREGHGHIDWVMAKGCRVLNIFKDTDIHEGSDHEPVVYTIRKNK